MCESVFTCVKASQICTPYSRSSRLYPDVARVPDGSGSPMVAMHSKVVRYDWKGKLFWETSNAYVPKTIAAPKMYRCLEIKNNRSHYHQDIGTIDIIFLNMSPDYNLVFF